MREHTHVWLKSPLRSCRFLALAKKPKINQRGSKIFAQKCIFLASYLNESARSRDQDMAKIVKSTLFCTLFWYNNIRVEFQLRRISSTLSSTYDTEVQNVFYFSGNRIRKSD